MFRFIIFGIYFFVTLLTFTSVHCAESKTEINSVKTFLLLKEHIFLDKFCLIYLKLFLLFVFHSFIKFNKSLIEYKPGFLLINHFAADNAPSEYKDLSKASI